MTAADEKKHCDHECVCNWWACHVHEGFTMYPCYGNPSCEHDTRARGTAPVCDDTCVYKRFAANMENAAAHDAEVASAAREEVLDELARWHNDMITNITSPKNGAVSIVSIRSAKFQHDRALEKIKSLRSEEKK